MGGGTFAGGKFNLTLSVRYDANGATLDGWREAFDLASQILFEATAGQHQFGEIAIGNNDTGGYNADAWLLAGNGNSHSGGYPGLGKTGIHQTLFDTSRRNPYEVAHEFGHYGYGMYDEYRDIAMHVAECLGKLTPCLMEGNRAPYRFCLHGEHDPDHDTLQHQMRRESCWETMVKLPYGLVAPGGIGGPPPPGPAPQAVPIRWIELVPQERTVLVIDRSSAIAGGELDEEKYGAHWWVDSALAGDRFGIVSYATGATVDYHLSPIDDNGPALHEAIDALKIELESKSAVGDGLRAALNEIRGAGPRAATQVIVLLSDGRHDGGEPPRDVLPDLVRSGVRVYTVAVGSEIDAALLEEIAAQTGGTFYHVDPALPPAGRDFELRLALHEISGIARENGGLVDSPAGSTSGDEQAAEVFIEPGCQMATFALSWQHPEDQFVLELKLPDGQTITPVTKTGAVHPYAGFRIDEPASGAWRLVVKPKQVAGEATYRLFAFSRNRRIGGGLASPRLFYELDEVIPLELQVYFDQPLTGLKVTGEVHGPGGARMPLEFVDDGNQEQGDALAGDGLYGALFRETGQPGIYTVEVSVESDGQSAAYPETGDHFQEGEVYQYDPIPPFRRRFKLALAVGLESPQ